MSLGRGTKGRAAETKERRYDGNSLGMPRLLEEIRVANRLQRLRLGRGVDAGSRGIRTSYSLRQMKIGKRGNELLGHGERVPYDRFGRSERCAAIWRRSTWSRIIWH